MERIQRKDAGQMNEKLITGPKELTMCRDCQHGEKDRYIPQMVFCRLMRRWMNESGFCSDGRTAE